MRITIIPAAVAVFVLEIVAARAIRDTVHRFSKRDTFQWGSIGDSYASGVAYLQSNTYDNNKGGCLRTTEAYAYQLKNDVSWMNGWQEYFSWAACSGSRLVNMQNQIGNTGSSPRLVTMHAGGNDANFFGIADNCVFHSQSKDYGLNYNEDPNRTGACAKAIDSAKNYIANSLGKDLNNTIDSIMASDNVKSQPDFLLYVLGYAQFFNGDTTWCNGHSFGVGSTWPPLSQYLRNDMNLLTKTFNGAYSSWAKAYPTKNVRYVSIDEAFEGHRFCDVGFNSIWGQYFDSEIWFWNVVPPNFAVSQSLNASSFERALQVAVGGDTVVDFSAGVGTGTVPNGWKLRPFHPKEDGHGAIEKVIVAQMQADGIPPS